MGVTGQPGRFMTEFAMNPHRVFPDGGSEVWTRECLLVAPWGRPSRCRDVMFGP